MQLIEANFTHSDDLSAGELFLLQTSWESEFAVKQNFLHKLQKANIVDNIVD